ncbi:hypothetical protein C3L33_20990, partial [Rhododendron williamsianum]
MHFWIDHHQSVVDRLSICGFRFLQLQSLIGEFFFPYGQAMVVANVLKLSQIIFETDRQDLYQLLVSFRRMKWNRWTNQRMICNVSLFGSSISDLSAQAEAVQAAAPSGHMKIASHRMESEDGLGTEAPQTLSTDWSVTWISSDIPISLWVHVVTDGSWNSDTRKAGAGWIIRTAEGQTLSKGGRGFSAVSALHAEYVGIYYALMWCFSNNFHHVKLSTDSLVIVRDLQQKKASEWLLLTLFDDVLSCIHRM